MTAGCPRSYVMIDSSEDIMVGGANGANVGANGPFV